MHEEIMDYRRKHLVLLVGGNPLPNLIAARLLAEPAGYVWLVHSDASEGKTSTKDVANRLKAEIENYIQGRTVDVKLLPVDPYDSNKIANRIFDLKKEMNAEDGQVGIHYTGGTKPMAVHVRQALLQYFPDTVCTYLDPSTLSLRVDYSPPDAEKVYPLQSKPEEIFPETQVSVEEIIRLHGYEETTCEKENWVEGKGKEKIVKAIHALFSSGKSEGWHNWLYEDFGFPILEEHGLQNLNETLAAYCSENSLEATEENLAKLLYQKGEKKSKFKSSKKWFRGIWLEDLAYQSLSNVKFPIESIRNKCFQYRERKADKFELDLAFMHGYQLFAISCIATTQKKKAKEHLLEVFVRAKQLGGDEARYGVICYVDTPTKLEAEIGREFDIPGRVKVFNMQAITDLKKEFEDWIVKANK